MASSELESNMSNKNLEKKTKINYSYILIIATRTNQILLKRYGFARAIYHTSKHFCACVCDRTPLLKGPGNTVVISGLLLLVSTWMC